MKSWASVREPRLAWALWQGLEKFSALLWDCYEEDFLDLAKEQGVERAKDSEEEIEIPF